MSEEFVQWDEQQMVEVALKEPDDFLKVRETLTRIGVALVKRKRFISLVTFSINVASTTSFTSKTVCIGWQADKSEHQ